MLDKLKLVRCIFFILIFANTSFSQINNYVTNEIETNVAERHMPFYNKARLSIESDQFAEAIAPLDSLLKIYPKSVGVVFLNGVCKLFKEETKKQSLVHLKSLSYKKDDLPFYDYWLALSYDKNDSVREATKYFTQFINANKASLDEDTKGLVADAQRSLDNVKAAGLLKDYSNFASVKNIGTPINSDASEYVPLVPSDESFMIFTYRGKLSKGGKKSVSTGIGMTSTKEEEKMYFEDVFISNKVNDTLWSEPKPIKSINSSLHDAAVTLSTDGTLLFIYKNIGIGNGDLYLSKLSGNNWSVPIYQKGLNTDKWDGSAAFFPDNNRIIFSSERKGGFGGKDLYMAEKIKDNTWGNIVNLGNTINSSYDEDAPFISADGKILFFASNGKLSTGGYDILRSDLTEKGWSAPYNIGKPVNTPNDDKFYMVTADSKKGYYSSKTLGGLGEQDIYCITPGIPGKTVRGVQVTGNINFNNKPVAGIIEIKSLTRTDIKTSVYLSNSVTGKFLANLPANDEFELTFSYKNYPVQKKMLSTKDIDSTVYLTVIADFYSDAYAKQMEKSRDNLDLITKQKHENLNLSDFRSKYGNLVIDSVTYQVQIAAYKFIENFDYSLSMRLGMKIRRSLLKGDVTRFTIGNYATFNEAEEKLKAVKDQAIKDAFIVVLYKDKFCYLVDVIKSGVYQTK